MTDSILTADFTNGGKARSAVLTISRLEAGRRERVSVHEVSGKREARALAVKLGAKPWNF